VEQFKENDKKRMEGITDKTKNNLKPA